MAAMMNRPPKRGEPKDSAKPRREDIDYYKRRQAAQEMAAAERLAEAQQHDPFIVVKWSEVEEKPVIPIGPDGVLPETGRAWMTGRYGSGKTTFAYWAALQRIRAGLHVGVMELELGEEDGKKLMRELGATNEELDKLHYFKMADETAQPNLIVYGIQLARKLDDLGCQMLIYDSAIALLQAAGNQENSSNDIREWANAAMSFPIKSGRLILVLDNTGHDGDRVRGSIDKSGAGDTNLFLKCTQAFRRGKSGEMQLSCPDKDRGGTLTGKTIDISVIANPDGIHLDLKPSEWSDMIPNPDVGEAKARGRKQLAGSQRKIADAIEERGPQTIPVLALVTGLGGEAVRSAVRRGCNKGVFSMDGTGRVRTPSQPDQQDR
jgi:hypothetical protein